jgi:DNA-binding MarR family transcriptional regulator
VTDGMEDARGPGQTAARRDQLLDQVAERSMVMARVMRLAVQEIRGTFTLRLVTERANGARPGPGSDPGFAEAQFHVLYALSQVDSLPVGEIAERCHVAVPTISRMLKHLEENGLIERHVDRKNRRFVRVVLTEAGRAAESQLEQRAKTALHHVLSPLTDEQLQDLIVAFDHLEGLVEQVECFK